MSNELLRTALQAAVPFWIEDAREWSFERRAREAANASAVIAAHGDDLMFGGKHTSEAFSSLARGLACCAFQPGGITFLEDHWEAKHDEAANA